MNKLIFEFEEDSDLEEFKSWLSNSGEQNFWEAQEMCDKPTNQHFNYHNPNWDDNIIKVTRVDEDE